MAIMRPMKIFYWVMGVLIAGTFVPSVLFFVLYLFGGNPEYGRRARGLWMASRLFGMLALNILIWGHVAVGLWYIWFR